MEREGKEKKDHGDRKDEIFEDGWKEVQERISDWGTKRSQGAKVRIDTMGEGQLLEGHE